MEGKEKEKERGLDEFEGKISNDNFFVLVKIIVKHEEWSRSRT